MKRLIHATLCVLALVVLVSCCPAPRAPRVADLAAEQWSRAVLIETTCRDARGDVSGGAFGSGVIVSPRRVLTARHVIDCLGATIRVTTIDGATQPVDIVATDGADVALLRLRSAVDIPRARLAPAMWGDKVCMSAARPQRARRCGDVAMVFPQRNGADIAHTIYIEHGNSGAGVWDSRGNLVGVITRLWQCTTEVRGQLATCGGAASSVFADRGWL